MRAVWSFWTKPFELHHKAVWASARQHLLAWVLSLETARQHYPQTALVTDDAGARLLIDGIGLDFDCVSLALNALDNRDPDWWALGKVYTYRLQDEPFIHLDNDVFLWKPLPQTVAEIRTGDVACAEWDETAHARPTLQPAVSRRYLRHLS